jgi:peptide/nickel transport system substrate-binding protein
MRDGVLILLLILSSSTMLLSHVTLAQPSRSEIPPRFSGQSTSPDTIIWETIGSPDNLDPHVNCESFGAWVLFNVYETLFTYPFNSSGTTPSIPLLAEGLVISDDGLNYTFRLRQGVRFQDGTSFNATCVKYNFERVMKIFDPYGPAWMFAEPILGGQAVEDAVYGHGNGSPEHIAAYDNWAVNSSAIIILDLYTIRLRLAHSYAPFLAAITNEVGAMMSPSWVEAHGGVQYGQHSTYVDTHTCGTGPYIVTSWVPNSFIELDIYPKYWRSAGARTAFSHAGGISHVFILTNDNTDGRIQNLTTGRTDGCNWPNTRANEIWNRVNGSSGDGTLKSLNPDLKLWCQEPTYSVVFIGFNMNSCLNSSGAVAQNPFAMKAFRESMSYAFDYDSYISQTLNGLGTQAQGPIPKGMFGHSDSLFLCVRDLGKAVQKWNTAMASGLDTILANLSYKIELDYYGVGENSARPCLMIKDAIESILSDAEALQPNHSLTIDTVALPGWLYSQQWNQGRLLLCPTGWIVDYADPDDFIGPFVRSTGYYATRIGLAGSDDWNASLVDGWISDAADELNPAARIALYGLIQDAIVNQCAYIWAYQAGNFHVESASMNGYVFNPMHDPYFYHYWKSVRTTTSAGFWNPISAAVTIVSVAAIVILGTAVVRSRRLAKSSEE